MRQPETRNKHTEKIFTEKKAKLTQVNQVNLNQVHHHQKASSITHQKGKNAVHH